MSKSDINSVTDQLAKTSVDSLSELSFAGRGFKLDSEKDAKEIVDAILQKEKLHILRLEGNTLGVDAAKAIAVALEKHPEFQHARWSDMFTGRLKSEIPHALRHLGSGLILAQAKLVELDLSDNAFGPNGMDGLVDLLKSQTCYSLKELRLNNNGLGVTGGKMLAKCLLECHTLSTAAGQPLALRVFVSGRGRLENEGSIALAEAFKAMGSLEEVAMPQNGINHVGITALADAFAENKQLRILNLNDNTFTVKGAKAMAKALPSLQKLEVINFGDCLVRTDGAALIAEAIKDTHPELKELNLSFNEIKQTGAKVIGEAMANKDSLQKLELDGNQLGDEGKELLHETLEAINKLDHLGSLSDDEGSEDEEDSNDENEDGDEEEEDEEDGEEVDDPALKVTGVAITPRPELKEIPAADFFQFPSPTKLLGISGESKAKAIVEHLGDDVLDLEKALQAVFKISAVVTPADKAIKKIACDCADEILRKTFQDKEENLGVTVANTILVNIGLLKSEDKRRAPEDITGSLEVLAHIVQQDYFPSAATDILQVFISRSHPLLDKSSTSKEAVLKSLGKA